MVKTLAPLQTALTHAVSGLWPIEQGFGVTAEQLSAAAVLVAACGKLIRQPKVFCATCCELEGDMSSCTSN